MADELPPLITDEMRAQIGKESEPTTSEVEKTAIRIFARSVGHTDPIYYDEAAAKAAGFRGLVAPPGYLGTPVFNPNSQSRRGGGGMFGGPEPSRTEIEYFEDICAGDVLTSTSHVANYEETKGSLGEMLITTNKTVYKNQDGKVVAISTGTGIRY